MSEKIIRDPVHDVIAFRTDRPIDALLFRLLNAAEFQRLRRIRQLGMAHLAYPGADHSRYSHSLGVMQTARRIIEQLRASFPIDERGELVCLCACLLHDLGHGPFSHVFERVSGIDHEELTTGVITDPAGEVHQLLAEHDPALPREVSELMSGKAAGGQAFLRDILSSQLDADRFDYLLRDNLMTGSRYGDYDLEWLVHALTVDRASGRLAVSWKGVSAVEAYLQSRYHMYRNVYFHKVVRSAEGMVKLTLQRAKRLAVQGRLAWPPWEHVVTKALLGRQLDVAEFTDFDDVSVQHCFQLWTKSDDATLAGLCRGLLFRKLYKTFDLTHVKDVAKVKAAVTAAEQAVGSAGGDVAYDLFYDEPADTPYEANAAADEIMVCDRDGNLTPFASLSPITQALNQQLMFRRLHVAPPWKDVAARAIGTVL
jgi:uncharacterized protein